jgi:hypothetical protein
MKLLKSAANISKRNKIIFTVIVLAWFCLLLLLTIYISDPNKGEPTA